MRFSLVKRKIKLLLRNKKKVFVIGFNKTGTTSIEKALLDLGYLVGNQREGELLFDDIQKGKFEGLIRYCKKSEAFQDVPFSLPGIYKILYKSFPDARFILSIRKDPEIWYNSLVEFHSKLWFGGENPSVERLKHVNYIYEGYSYKVMNYIYQTQDVYNKENCIYTYQKHNEEVKAFFIDKEDQLLELDISTEDSYLKLCQFLNCKPLGNSFPWENKTVEIL